MNEKEQIILKMYLSNRKKKIIIITTVIVCVVIILFGIFVYWLFNSFKLDNDIVTIEYGETYTPSLSDFVTFDKDVSEENTRLDYSFKNEEGKDYLAVGDYPVTITHTKTFVMFNGTLFSKTFTKVGKVIVKDTIPPQFASDCPVELNLQSTNINITDYFSATDLSGIFNIYLKGDGTDLTAGGTYTVTIVATDNQGNSSETQCVVNITVPSLSVEQTDFNLKVNDTAQIVTHYEGFDSPRYSTSDNSMLTVTTSGEIKALREGSCIVTVSCNGLSVKCNITITENETQSIQTSSTTSSENNSSTKRNNNTSSGSNSSSSSNRSNDSSGNNNSNNYPEKEFLFTDGYTMENVADAAYAYLKASGKSGRCVPIKNSEGIYLGMRVEFD